jgi:hypothetical protein
MQRRSFRLPDEVDRVPRDLGGIYQFCLRFPSDYELGLLRTQPDLESVRALLLRYFAETAPLFGLVGLIGELRSPAYAHHLRVVFTIDGKRTDTSAISERMAAYLLRTTTCVKDTLMTTAVIRKAFDIAPPVYVGIAAEQSLAARLNQHLSGSTNLAKRIAEFGMSWNHFEYRCSPLPVDSGPVIADLEVILQGIFKPQLSDR